MYERAAGDKTLPSDLRPPEVLKATLDYLFHDLLPRGGFSPTFSFIRDRSRAVRNDFTMQHQTGALAIECHDRCARFHIIALHVQRDVEGFSIALEEQQLMNTLQSLKEFYEDQRGRYESPTELEMRVYHRLIHIRDQKERHDDIPDHIRSHPVFKLTTDFRVHVQKKSAPISKISKLVVGPEGMQIFGQLAELLRQQGSMVMIYLVACILERLFGKDAIDDIEALRGDLSIPDIIDGVSVPPAVAGQEDVDLDEDEAFIQELEDELMEEQEEPEVQLATAPPTTSPLKPSPTLWLNEAFPTGPPPSTKPAASAFAGLSATPNAFAAPSVFGAKSVFGNTTAQPSAFGGAGFTTGAPSSNLPPKKSLADAPPLAEIVDPPAASQPSVPESSPFSGFKGISTPPSAFQPFTNGVSAPAAVSTNGFVMSNGPTPPTTSPFAPQASSSSLNPTAPAFTPNPIVSPFNLPSAFTSAPTQAPNPFVSEPTPTPPSPPKPVFPANPTPSLAPASSKPNGFNTSSFQATTSNQFLSPLSAWTSPAESSTTTPPGVSTLPKIDTTVPGPQESAPMSPGLPPALGRKAPISLPSTPTLVAPLARPHLGFLKNGLLQTPPPSGVRDDILSPLSLQSPAISRGPLLFNMTPTASPMPSPEKPPPPSAPQVNGKPSLKGKEKAIPSEEDTKAREASALSFERRGVAVKECFHRWQRRATDRAAWIEACRNSDAYQQKVQRERLLGSPAEKRRRRPSQLLDGTQGESPVKKRARKRVSDEYKPPRTDEELARRLKENQEEHERRWARGSFLQVLRTHVHTKARTQSANVPPNWRAWLSLNPDTDATAIWLERKFDVPASGRWESETVFSIPLNNDEGASVPGHPGLIVLECSPLEGIKDELERKYRILDDCGRLRDLVNALPARRYFVPSLLVLSWSDNQQLASDMSDMVNTYIKDSALKSAHVFAFTSATKDLDRKFSEALESLACDVEGELIMTLSIRSIFQLFEPSFKTFVSEALEICSQHGYFDWYLFSKVVAGVVDILNLSAKHVIELANLGVDPIPIPSFDGGDAQDQDTMFGAVLSWLSYDAFPDAAANVISDLKSHQSMGRDFPASPFLEHLVELGRHRIVDRFATDLGKKFYVLKSDVEAHLADVNALVDSLVLKLGEALKLSIRRSPKRRSMSLVSDVSGLDAPAPKRARLSDSWSSSARDDSPPFLQVNGRSSPSPSVSTVSAAQTDSSIVTVSMLKALTRDIKKKYGVS
ncbi:hypothetical protein HGRIS_010589 [Hohenbuehelia grisea]|uniref:SAC3/GANP/THP3 conserved domain-containing protein n=1 Tax=Hohenbuehelia grisea TaxID=104357 RepID=A0ABR3IXF4_9AGAR